MHRPWKSVSRSGSHTRIPFLATLVVAAAGGLISPAAHTATETYTYDVHGRIKSQARTTDAGDVVTISYDFDAAGNRENVVTTTVDPIPPSVPTGLTATVISITRIDLSWSASSDGGSSGIAGYKIRRNGALIGSTGASSYSDTTVVGSTTYQYTISAYDGQGNESGQSSPVTVSTPDVTAPSTPTGLTGYPVDPNWINLSWNHSNDTGGSGLAGYEIYRGGSLIGTSITNSYADHTVAASTQYSYQVKAYDGAGNRSGFSSSFSVTTPNAPDTTPPTVPTGLAASAPASGTVNLSWTASTDPGPGATGVAGYRIYRGGSYIGSTGATSFSDGTTAGSTYYTYQVLAYDGAGNESALSSAVGITTPDSIAPSTPTGLSAYAPASNQVNLSWTASTDAGGSGVAGYRIYRNGAYIGATAATSYSDTTTAANTYYTYQVQAYDGANNTSGLSSAVGVTPPDTIVPSAPGTPNFSAITGNSATASWGAASDNVGVTGYRYSLNGGASWTSAGTSLSVNLSGLTRSTSYTLWVQARDAAGNWGSASSSSFTTAAYYTDYLTMTVGTVGDGYSSPQYTGYGRSWGSITPNTIYSGKTVFSYYSSYQLYFDGVNWTTSVQTVLQISGFSSNPGKQWLQSVSGAGAGSSASSFGCNLSSTICTWIWPTYVTMSSGSVAIVHE